MKRSAEFMTVEIIRKRGKSIFETIEKNKKQKLEKQKLEKHELEKKCVIYCRVSTKEQSLEMQRMECIKFAEKNCYEIKDIVNEKKSARSFSNLKELRKIIEENTNIIILVYSVDRFCRNTKDALDLLPLLDDKKISLESVSEQIDLSTASGRHSFRQRMSAAELESDLISERIKRTTDYKKNLGHIGGKAPYGYKKPFEIINGQKICKSLEQEESEQTIKRIIRKIRNRYLNSEQITNILKEELKQEIEPVEIYENDIEIKHKTKISDICLCDILNSYYLFKRGKLWGVSEITNVYNEWKNLRINL